MCKELILSWQDMKSREWFAVGRLAFLNDKYSFVYIKGALKAKESGFLGLAGMPDFSKQYRSERIFPVFQNRILNKSRPDRPQFLSWLDMNIESYSAFEELARTGGIKATDSLRLYPVPSKVNGKYSVHFFVHGISHLSKEHQERVSRIASGEKVYLCADLENEYDKNALILRTKEPVGIIGYCPQFFAEDFYSLFQTSNNFSINLIKVNDKAPRQLSILCALNCEWPENFKPFFKEEFQSIHIDE